MVANETDMTIRVMASKTAKSVTLTQKFGVSAVAAGRFELSTKGSLRAASSADKGP